MSVKFKSSGRVVEGEGDLDRVKRIRREQSLRTEFVMLNQKMSTDVSGDLARIRSDSAALGVMLLAASPNPTEVAKLGGRIERRAKKIEARDKRDLALRRLVRAGLIVRES